MEEIYLSCFEAQQPIFALRLGLTQTQASASWLLALPTDCLMPFFFVIHQLWTPSWDLALLTSHCHELSRAWFGFSWAASILQQACPIALLPGLKCWLCFYGLAIGKWKVGTLPMHRACLLLIPYQAPNSEEHTFFCPSTLTILENVHLELWPHSGNSPSPRTEAGR